MAWAAADGEVDVSSAEAGLAVLLEACERSLEEMGGSVPPAQMRALLIIESAGSLNLSRLAGALGASASAASRLVDRMQLAELLTRDRAAASLADLIGEDDPEVEHTLDMESVAAHWDELPRREQKILLLRFYGDMTQAEIGQQLGISQMHVSRLLAHALGHLRHRLLGLQEAAPATGLAGASS